MPGDVVKGYRLLRVGNVYRCEVRNLQPGEYVERNGQYVVDVISSDGVERVREEEIYCATPQALVDGPMQRELTSILEAISQSELRLQSLEAAVDALAVDD